MKKYKAGDQIQLDKEKDYLIMRELEIIDGGHVLMRSVMAAMGEARNRLWTEIHKKFPELGEYDMTADMINGKLTVLREKEK